MEASNEAIEIKASLFNDSKDTAYFLSSTCDGEQYSIIYDQFHFTLTPFILCNASYPKLIRIAPLGQHDFTAHFNCKNNPSKIKLGFDFYAVNRAFDVNKIDIPLSLIHNRNSNEQTIIWADEKEIK